MEENKEDGWALGSQHVTYYMNTSVSATTSKAPYKVVFGQAPRTSCAVLEMLAQQGVVNEEDTGDGLTECDEDQQGEVTSTL